MYSINRRGKHFPQRLFSAFSPVALVLMLLMGIWFGLLPDAQAQAANYVLASDGRDDFVNIPIESAGSGPTLELNDGFTVEAWVKLPGTEKPFAGQKLGAALYRFQNCHRGKLAKNRLLHT